MNNRRFFFAVSAVVAFALAGCSSSDESESPDNGTAPRIVDVTLDKAEIGVGKAETVTFTLAYADDDADIAKVVTRSTFAGTSHAPDDLAIADAAGQKEGSKAFVLQLVVSKAGPYVIDLWLVDSKGNESAKMTRTIEAK